MTNEKLKQLLQKVDLKSCTPVVDNYIYYAKMPIRQRCYYGVNSYKYTVDGKEFLLIAENGVKQAIILRYDDGDLHWYVSKRWRNKHILSNALRTGVVRKVWSDNSLVRCCYDFTDELPYGQKRELTKHLADVAGVPFVED